MNLYTVETDTLKYYVLAKHLTEAQTKVENALEEAAYGFTQERKVKIITLIATEIKKGEDETLKFNDEDKLIL